MFEDGRFNGYYEEKDLILLLDGVLPTALRSYPLGIHATFVFVVLTLQCSEPHLERGY